MITSSVMVYGGYDHTEVRLGRVEGLFAQMSGGGLYMLLYYSCPVLCFFSLWWDGPGCDWLSARHDVWQLFIREAMKGPPP